MRKIPASDVIEAVAHMSVHANHNLPQDVRLALTKAKKNETSPVAQEILHQLLKNADLAACSGLPLCQDTGLAVFFVEMGEDCRVEGMTIKQAITTGVREGYAKGLLRKSVCDPLTRVNTGDNTPAIIHIDLVEGNSLKIAFMAKGGGSENMSRVTMLTPAQGWEGIKDFVLQRVAEAGPNPCPPTIIGLGIGGTFELAPKLAKQALLRKLGDVHPDPETADREAELLSALNTLGIGPMGLGGKTTVLDVKIAMAPCHLASLPVAINVQCHSSRHMEITL